MNTMANIPPDDAKKLKEIQDDLEKLKEKHSDFVLIGVGAIVNKKDEFSPHYILFSGGESIRPLDALGFLLDAQKALIERSRETQIQTTEIANQLHNQLTKITTKTDGDVRINNN